MPRLLEQSPPRRPPRKGEVVEGEVIRADSAGILISLGLKTEGIVPPEEMRRLSREDLKKFKPGDTILVTFVGGEGPGGMMVLSFDQAEKERAWRQMEQHAADGDEVTARIIDSNRGGLVVDLQGIRGFVPISHAAPLSDEERKGRGLEARIGEEARFNILEMDRSGDRLILSERAIWQRRREEVRERIILAQKEGTRLKGKISSIQPFGAFVDVGEADGLIPLSELSWESVKSVGDVVRTGDEVETYVLRVDREKKQITLSLKRTQPEPWDTVCERYQEGQLVQGVVTRLADFGAFVKLEDTIEGLIHISELSPRRVRHPKECVYVGQKVTVMVITIDVRKRRISLSYKQAFGL
jgi:small subunit ribosomal protein S1